MLYVFIRNTFSKDKFAKSFGFLPLLQNLHILLFDKPSCGMYNTRKCFVLI